MSDQSLFDFDDETPVEQPTAPRVYTWKWWDPWPEGLSYRERCMRQIQRDQRALEEEPETDMRDFFLARIAAFQKELT